MHIVLRMTPPRVTAQQRRVAVARGKPLIYKPARLRQAEEELETLLTPHAPAEPLDGPIRLAVTWAYPRGRHGDGEPKTTRPDADNLHKSLQDVMTSCGFWHDDAQVVDLTVRKIWAEEPGITIDIDRLGGE